MPSFRLVIYRSTLSIPLIVCGQQRVPFNFASKGCTGVYVHLDRGVRIKNTAVVPESERQVKRKLLKWIFPLQEPFFYTIFSLDTT